MKKAEPLNTQPFFHKRGPVGCLLIHGFTGSPPELQLLGEYLADKNITVSGIQLAGHGTTPDDMAKTTWRDWVASAEAGLEELRGQCSEVFVCGLSMGGAITLYLAENHELPGAISMAGAVVVKDWKLSLLPFVRPFIRFFPKSNDVDLVDVSALEFIKTYEYTPLDSVKNLLELVKTTREGLPRVKCPLLIMQGMRDMLVAPSTAQLIHDSVSSEHKELLFLENSGHCIPVDAQKDVAFDRTHQWIRRFSSMSDSIK